MDLLYFWVSEDPKKRVMKINKVFKKDFLNGDVRSAEQEVLVYYAHLHEDEACRRRRMCFAHSFLFISEAFSDNA